MKKYAFILAAALMAACLVPLHAQTGIERIQNLEHGVSAVQSSLDSLCTILSGIGEEIEEQASDIEDLNDRVSSLQDGKRTSFLDIRHYSEIAMKWACLLLFAVFLPLLLVRLFSSKFREDQRRYDIVVDLIRSGVEIKPEMREYLTGIGRAGAGRTMHSGALSGMNQTDLDYCSKRLLWAVCLLIIGITIASISNEGVIFGIFACIAAIFAVQAVVRYFSVRYFNEHLVNKDRTDAE